MTPTVDEVKKEIAETVLAILDPANSWSMPSLEIRLEACELLLSLILEEKG